MNPARIGPPQPEGGIMSGCLSIGWVEGMIIDLIWICALIAIIRLLIPLMVSVLAPIIGAGATIVGQIINIILYAIIAVFVVYIVFGLIGCIPLGFHMGGPIR
jgi:hypothetical protein